MNLGGVPLIYAVEVHGAEAKLRLLGAEHGVVGFEIAAVGSEARWARPPFMGLPPFQGSPGTGPADDEHALYQRLSTLASREIEKGE